MGWGLQVGGGWGEGMRNKRCHSTHICPAPCALAADTTENASPTSRSIILKELGAALFESLQLNKDVAPASAL